MVNHEAKFDDRQCKSSLLQFGNILERTIFGNQAIFAVVFSQDISEQVRRRSRRGTGEGKNGDLRFFGRQSEIGKNSFSSVEIDRLSINLSIPNGPGINQEQAFTNYTKSVDEALRGLLEAQDAQFPLTISTNK
jgi:hypothetical protein